MKNWMMGGVALGAGVLGASVFTVLASRRAEASVPMDGRIVTAGKYRLHVAEEGEGRPLLLIHGLGGQMRNFGRAMIADLARDYRVIRVDRPGSGYSPRLADGSAHLHDQADAIAALIDELELDQPVLVGHSLGGALSLATAVRHPTKVGALALIAPASQPVEEIPEAFKGLMVPPGLIPLISWTLAVPLGIATRDKVLHEVFKPDPVPADFLVEGGGALGFRPVAFQGAATDISHAREDSAEMLEGYAALKIPVGILFGREDNLLDYRLHGELTASQIPGAKLLLTEGGHMLPFTAPEETARFVRSVIE